MKAWRLLTGVQRSLGHLRTVSDLPALYERGVRLLCEVCGFDRAFFTRVDGSLMRIEYVHFPRDPELAATFREAATAGPPKLDHLLLETEMIRRRAPLLVTDAANDPRTHRALTQLGLTRSYVAAPILPAGKVVGFLHADRYDSGQNVDELDRDGLFAFAAGFGYAIERVRLLERLRAQRDQVLTLVHQTEELFADFSHEDPALAEPALGGGPAGGGVGTPIASPPRTGIAELLTRRELEVLQLLADGSTNAQIADALVISQTTAKSHVQSILRKLQASNRAEAVSRYLRVASR
jgi:DNA-binding CsgD family transcriptional regulator